MTYLDLSQPYHRPLEFSADPAELMGNQAQGTPFKLVVPVSGNDALIWTRHQWREPGHRRGFMAGIWNHQDLAGLTASFQDAVVSRIWNDSSGRRLRVG